MKASITFALLGSIAMCAGCAPGVAPLATGPAIPAPGRPIVYAALGASETSGVGLEDTTLRSRYAWPQLFFNMALPRAATYYNFAEPGITTEAALQSEVPAAVAVRPDVVTVFFNLDDLVHGVSPAEFERHLGMLVHAMRQGGKARVLVANAPPVDNLPAFQACEGHAEQGVTCPAPPGVVLPPLAAIDAEISAYDGAVAAVVADQRATLVDIRADGALTAQRQYVGPDGLHPSPLGDEVIAQLFSAALRAAGGA